MTFVDPDTGLVVTCQPWEYAEMAKSRRCLEKGVKNERQHSFPE